MRCVVFGYGSVGKRHTRNLKTLGVECLVIDPEISRQDEARNDDYEVFTSVSSLPNSSDFDAVLVCSPTKFHIEHLKWGLSLGKKIFLEKPISMNLMDCADIPSAHHKSVFVGYTYRWNTQFIELKDAVDSGLIGRPYYASFKVGMNLEDWHPWEHYVDFFMSKKSMGGGALLDESHFLELAIELFGMPRQIFGQQSKISNLTIDSDDYVCALLRYENLMVEVNLDLFRRPHQSSIEISGSQGSIFCDLVKRTNSFTLSKSYAKFDTEVREFSYDRNDMFLEMIRDFLLFVDSEKPNPRVPFSRGLEVMEVIEMIRESSLNEFWTTRA
jgi:predicted dehydrogenase